MFSKKIFATQNTETIQNRSVLKSWRSWGHSSFSCKQKAIFFEVIMNGFCIKIRLGVVRSWCGITLHSDACDGIVLLFNGRGQRGIWWPHRAAPPLTPPRRWCHRSCDLHMTPGCRCRAAWEHETTSERLRFHQRTPVSHRSGLPVCPGDRGILY